MFPAAGDDQWLAVTARTDAEFQALCDVIGRPELAADARYATLTQRLRHQDELEAEIATWTRGQDKHAAAERLHAAGVPAAPVNDAAEATASPYLAYRQHFTTLEHPEIGPIAHEGLPFRLAETPGAQHRAAPCLGQDTLAILRDTLGLTDTEIAQLERDGTIAADPG
jgi:crotonobetainyl-CoA:carnitine CoA-transferase CaiB-like acyl-CoA transferase